MPAGLPLHSMLHYLAGTGVRLRMRRQARQFMTLLGDPRAAQQSVLRDLLALNADGDFAQKHRFHEIRTVDDFRRRVPVADYDAYVPYIERVKRGETGALLGSRNRLLMFALSSGTTAAAKFLPITRRFFDDYRRGWRIWGIGAYDDHPRMFRQSIVQLSSNHDQFRTEGGYPCGNISGLVSAMQLRFIQGLYAVPGAVAKISAPDAKYYIAMRLALADARVGLVMTANPSTLIHLAKLADAHREELIRDIADGTISSRFEVDANVHRLLRRRLRRNPDRARALEQIVEATGHLRPRNCWPGLTLLAVWSGGSAGAYVRGMRTWFGDVPIRDHGLSASEGRMTIPLADNRADGVLDVSTHFFEFIPEGEYGSAHPTVLEAHELEEGQNYYILLTTSAGLCRYDIRDVVRCTGFLDRTPLLEFLNKGSQISSITGEKVSESQVVAAIGSALAALEISLSNYTVAPAWGDPPGYRLLVESPELPSPDLAARLAARADDALQSQNLEYCEKRRSGRLARLETTLVPAGSWARLARDRQARLGSSLEQYKHPCLVPDLGFYERFVGECRVHAVQSANA
jgi:hypothetical protein